mmetsp:Transcript_24733/g.59619  ORF Transcript_24733/g.59619 Transcript_24733/m.59619 type:complete len:306 (+) Transcript_24733:129-1046(+)
MKSFWGTFLFASNIKALLTQSAFCPHRHTASVSSLNMVATNNDLNRAKKLISQAISIGAPAYNAGDIKKCAEVYRDTAKDIGPLLPSNFQTKLLSELEEKRDANYDTKAWAFRRVFDSIVEYELPLSPQDVSDQNITFEPFTSSQLSGEPVGVMDSVMGGISNGSWIAKSNIFFGQTSLANNGGFASLRWRFQNVQNWSYAKGIYMKGLKHTKAEEHTFRIILKDATCERVRLANYKAVFANPQREDQPLLIPFSVFNQMEQMGRSMDGSPAFNPLVVTEIGLMAIKPTVVGEFQLEFSEWGLYT